MTDAPFPSPTIPSRQCPDGTPVTLWYYSQGRGAIAKAYGITAVGYVTATFRTAEIQDYSESEVHYHVGLCEEADFLVIFHC